MSRRDAMVADRVGKELEEYPWGNRLGSQALASVIKLYCSLLLKREKRGKVAGRAGKGV